MKIEILHLLEGARKACGLTVIIDVFRAFSTACYAVQNGAEQIIPVGDLKLAYQLKKENPGFILIGERGGVIQPGFDYGNSPSQIENIPFAGKTIVQTTSAGTQGFANANAADELISGSFVNADAIVLYVRARSPERVSLVCMGSEAVEPNAEDSLCGLYIKDLLLGEKTDPQGIIEQIRNSSSSRKFFDPAMGWAPQRDFELCLDISRFGFVLRAEPYMGRLLSLKPVDMNNPAC